MQNNNTGMLATRVPVWVVPSPPRWPSWKIHTSAPNAAVSESMFSTRAFSGTTTLPVSRNSNPNMMTAIRPSTSGRVDVIAFTLSRLVCAVPVNSTVRPPGPSTACKRSSWVSEASENSGAVVATVRYMLPSRAAVGADGAPVLLPAT